MRRDEDKRRLHAGMAIASFSAGVMIAAVCIFFIEPLGEIANSAISIVSELLVLTGAILGIKTNFDTKLARFEGEVRSRLKHDEDELHSKI